MSRDGANSGLSRSVTGIVTRWPGPARRAAPRSAAPGLPVRSRSYARVFIDVPETDGLGFTRPGYASPPRSRSSTWIISATMPVVATLRLSHASREVGGLPYADFDLIRPLADPAASVDRHEELTEPGLMRCHLAASAEPENANVSLTAPECDRCGMSCSYGVVLLDPEPILNREVNDLHPPNLSVRECTLDRTIRKRRDGEARRRSARAHATRPRRCSDASR